MDAQDKSFSTPLHAILSSPTPLHSILVHWSPPRVALCSSESEVVELLLECGANVSMRNK